MARERERDAPRGRDRDDRDRDRGRERDRDRGNGKSRVAGRDDRRSGFKYRERSVDDVRRRAERQGGRFDSPFKAGFDTHRLEVGDNLLRILPPTWEDRDHYGYSVWMHSYVGPDSSTYLCPFKMKQERCPICEAAKEARNSGETEEARQLQASEKFVCWIVDRDEKELTPALFVMSWTMDRDIASLCFNKRNGSILLVDHPDKGYDLTIKRAGQGLKTKYFGMAFDRDPSPISDDDAEQERVLSYIEDNPVPSTLHFHEAAYLEKMLSGTSEKRDPDLDDEEGEEKEAKGDKRGSRDRERGGRDREREREPERNERRTRDRDDDRRGGKRDDPEDEPAEDPVDDEAELEADLERELEAEEGEEEPEKEERSRDRERGSRDRREDPPRRASERGREREREPSRGSRR